LPENQLRRARGAPSVNPALVITAAPTDARPPPTHAELSALNARMFMHWPACSLVIFSQLHRPAAAAWRRRLLIPTRIKGQNPRRPAGPIDLTKLMQPQSVSPGTTCSGLLADKPREKVGCRSRVDGRGAGTGVAGARTGRSGGVEPRRGARDRLAMSGGGGVRRSGGRRKPGWDAIKRRDGVCMRCLVLWDQPDRGRQDDLDERRRRPLGRRGGGIAFLLARMSWEHAYLGNCRRES
jgi:hypothetical protein